jgi:23S rRNA G2445 N2-methylase RlmL
VRGDKINHNLRRQLIETIIKTIRAPLFFNSPSNYDIELRLVIEKDNLKVLWKPFTIIDSRFLYRVRDIPASINPVVAAGIVRFLKSKIEFSNSSRILDPFCGSATMLIERAFAGDYRELVGVDISKKAIEAAKENINKSQLEKVVVENKDMRDIEKTDFFDEIISNMPFGIRTGNHTSNEKLYRDFFNLASTILRPKGFLAIFTQEIKLTNQLFREFIDDFALIERQQIESGGLRPVLFIAAKR